MSILAAPVHHDIKDPKDWPQQCSEISHLLFRPLPKCVASKAQERREFLSLGCWELYEEALRSPLFAVRDEDTSEQPTTAVTDVMDSILSCVMMVKVASSVCSSRGNKQARLSWISVLSQLGIGISEDIVLLEDAMFLRARTCKKSVVTDIEDVVGRSSLLLATLLNPLPDINDMSDTRMIVETEPEIRSCNSPIASEGSSEGLSIPFDAHILPGCGRRVNCLLPVVCVAPEHEIESLLTSVVCQRYVLKITLPVVGVSLPTSGTTATIVLCWVEGQEDDCDTVPVIHMACVEGDNIHPSVGVFDLLDPTSMMYFGQFILGLQPYFSSIKESDTLSARKYCWRLDHVGYDHLTQYSDSSSNNLSWIKSWFHGLYAEISEPCGSGTKDQSSGSTDMPAKKRGSSTQSKASSSSQFLQVPPSQSHGGRSRSHIRQSQQSIGTFGSSSSSDGSEDDELRSRSASPASTASYYPASRFAKLRPENGLVEQWLFERRTIRLFRIELPAANSDLESQVNEMIQEYNTLTQFSWPESWSNISRVPPRDSVHETIRKTLFGSYQDYKTRNSDIPAMEEDVFRSINNHVSALYRAVANAKASDQQAKVKEATEAALRSSWDELLKAVCCDVDDAVSTFVILERSIPLPRNMATELGTTFGAEPQAQVQRGLLTSQLKEAEESETVPPAIRSGVALSYLRTQSLKPPTILKPEDRSYEPATAIVDATCYLHYDIQNPAPRKSQESKGGKPIAAGNPESKTKEKQPMGWMSRFIKKVSPKSGINKACKGRKSDKSLPPSKNEEDRIFVRHATCCMCSFVTDSLAPKSSKSGFDSSTEIHIPYLFTEYKRDQRGEHQAFHQAEMYVTFGLEFLAALGIKDEPVWALVTSGTIGTVIMAWKSTVKKSRKANAATVDYNFILDQYIRSFDISQPLEALQLMACLRRIYQRGLTLQATLVQRIDPSVFTNPTAAIQGRMMPPRSESQTEAQPSGT